MFLIDNTKVNNIGEMSKENSVVAQQVLCLVHTCGSTECGHVTMKLELSEDGQYLEMHSFANSFGFQYHPDVKYKFERAQYINILTKLQHICDTTKGYQEYSKFESERFYRENAYLFDRDYTNGEKISLNI